ncbi:hypothetical protein EXE42_06075 [Halorubrum sp. SP3]|nr:hypothetical protein EXE42_06075 [Halorubrum sp. SP3]
MLTPDRRPPPQKGLRFETLRASRDRGTAVAFIIASERRARAGESACDRCPECDLADSRADDICPECGARIGGHDASTDR